MKTYTSKPNEDLGSIARKFWLPSWKYLYEINKDVIGDNPDLLQPGTKLKIPQWDTTSGDEKIKDKDVDPRSYVNGNMYKYPWVAYSRTLMMNSSDLYKDRNADGEMSSTYTTEKKYSLKDKEGKRIFAEGTIKDAEQLEVLIPDYNEPVLYIDDIMFI